MVAQFLIFTFANFFAISLYFSNFLHIQEPKDDVFFIVQNDPLQIKYLRTQLTHSDEWAAKILHISFKQLTLLASKIGLKPKPPSSFGLQTSLHAILAFFELSSGPDQRNATEFVDFC